ncbi:MAG: hypothetical protein II873_11485 [Oscillospiraceae bacterium]|nr:hypothetical protein [Oscillospiraceae bacterium]
MKKFRCFNPPENSPFVFGAFYECVPCLDGWVIYQDGKQIWTTDEFEFYKYFHPISDSEPIQTEQ